MQKALPEKFIQAMKAQLPQAEWDAFFSIYEKPHFKGIRVNALKCDREKFEKISPFALKQVEWEQNAYRVDVEKVGAHPYHFAGVYYSQEPSATCAAPLLDVKPGEKVLDLCSAPGGKGTQLAAKMQGEGLIVLNEPVFSRAKILLQNVERMGVKNAVVLSETPQKLAQYLQGYFDKILVDAPCSGEGMFRKNADEALGEWSEENVAFCAERQAEILDSATKMLKKGGRLVYSTCTFSVAEDEGQVSNYLKNHPEMRLIQKEKLYPHKVDGEGHFAALFEKTDGDEEYVKKAFLPKISSQSEKILKTFENGCFLPKNARILHEKEGVLYEFASELFDYTKFNVLRVGVRLGEVKNGRFEPSHAYAMSAKRAEIKNALDLRIEDTRVEKFLRGESVQASEDEVKDGWCIVCVDSFPVGWGKAVGGTVKNHIPKGIRKLS